MHASPTSVLGGHKAMAWRLPLLQPPWRKMEELCSVARMSPPAQLCPAQRPEGLRIGRVPPPGDPPAACVQGLHRRGRYRAAMRLVIGLVKVANKN
uniref:Uncharacterized protein n=1 Tax=Sphaerodactylus townsendi TaxID=933632 RepID=A0ACB8G1S4_9SAUR